MVQHTRSSELAVKCLCGFEAWTTEDELIVIVQEHGIEAHNVNLTFERVVERMRSESLDATAEHSMLRASARP
jgi:hypothetical protein